MISSCELQVGVAMIRLDTVLKEIVQTCIVTSLGGIIDLSLRKFRIWPNGMPGLSMKGQPSLSRSSLCFPLNIDESIDCSERNVASRVS
jgi:hypothetical protein